MGDQNLKNELTTIFSVIDKTEGMQQSMQYNNLNLENSKWIIPAYQRGYSWDKQQFNGFNDTIHEIASRSGIDLKYFGQLIMHTNSNNDIEIVDGQQRLTTFMILAKIMLEDLENDEYSDVVIKNKLKKYLYVRDGSPRFVHQEKNKKIVYEYIYLEKPSLGCTSEIEEYHCSIIDKNPTTENINEYRAMLSKHYRKNNKYKAADYGSIITGYEIIKSKYDEISNMGNYRVQLATNLVAYDKVKVSILLGNSFDMAYESFMALNGKGRPLSEYDLVKSVFIGELGKTNTNIEKDWNENIDLPELSSKKIVDILDIMLKIEYADEYFEFNKLSSSKGLKRSELHKLLSEQKDCVDFEKLYEKFKVYIDNFQEMKDGHFSKVISMNRYNEYNDSVKSLIDMDYIPFLPLIFEYIKKEDHEDPTKFEEILNIAKYVPFIHVTVNGKRPSNLNDICIDYLNPHIVADLGENKLNVLKTKIRKLCSREVFASNLPEVDFKKNEIPKDVLLLLEPNCNQATKYANTLEHIYPQKAKVKDWPMIKDKAEVVYKIGNFAIISSNDNSKLGNKSFEEKMDYISNNKSNFTAFKFISTLHDDYIKNNIEYSDEYVLARSNEYSELLQEKFRDMGLF